jgi:hypothetical protein
VSIQADIMTEIKAFESIENKTKIDYAKLFASINDALYGLNEDEIEEYIDWYMGD